jgi:hypothetical protein
MRKIIITAIVVVAGCSAGLHTTPQTREADCRTWQTRAQAEEARAAQLHGGKGTYTAQSNAERYRDAVKENCGIADPNIGIK